MSDKFSIENFVEDSVSDFEESSRDFRSIREEIDKRINEASEDRNSLLTERIRGKLSRIKSTIILDSDNVPAYEKSDEKSAEEVHTEEEFFEDDETSFSEDVFFEDSQTENSDGSEDVWTGSVIDRLRAFGYIDVTENSASGDIEFEGELVENGNSEKDIEEMFRKAACDKEQPAEEKSPASNVSLQRKQRQTSASVSRERNIEKQQRVTGYEKLSVIPKRKYVYPKVDLIRPEGIDFKKNSSADRIVEEEIKNKSEKLVATFRSFGIGITITGVTRGPSVTRFEFQPEIGVRISKIVALTDDIALSLAASAVRMEAPIPGKSAIGIEIPNETVDTVYLYDVINSPEYKNAKSKIAFALGKDIEGKIVIADLARMPHVLIAGSTGSGKSVCINTIISGILYGASPDEVKFIMIDPKVVELGMYNNIPHLLIPVVTEPKKAASALAWAVGEVERRYRLFAEHNVRDIFSFNKIYDEAGDAAGVEKMPQIVIIIDELADLMMAASQDVEKSIIRLAQKARAAGVHLVIATQRPSVDVITGLIKANIPSRIAFAVASSFDSRTILDTIGAEKLLGRGDMLYHPIGVAKSRRVQGAFVSDAEVERITEFVKNSYGEPNFDESVKESIERTAEEMNKGSGGKSAKNDSSENVSDGDEELIMMAAELGLKQKQLSASNLQRKLKLGYSRAARIIDRLEEIGFLTVSDGSKPRQVIMTEAEWIEYNAPCDEADED